MADLKENIEQHPLSPFCPPHSKLLMLGSFPPPLKRWSMNFFYPNFQNDMWRIFSLIFTQDKNTFIDLANKSFKLEDIIQLLNQYGIALYDAATAVVRLQENASDKFLKIVEPTDIEALLLQLPECHTIVSTGQKSTDILSTKYGFAVPKLGNYTTVKIGDKEIRFYRMPSSSRAYPLAIEKKADFYRNMFLDVGVL